MEKTYYFRVNDRSLLKVIRDDKKLKTRIVLIDTLGQIKDTVLYDPDKDNIESINNSLRAISNLADENMMGDTERSIYLQKAFKIIDKLNVQKFVNESVILLHTNESQILIDTKHMLVLTKETEDGKSYIRVELRRIPCLGVTLSTRYTQAIIDKDYDNQNKVLNKTTLMITNVEGNIEGSQEAFNHLLIKLRDESFVKDYYNMFLGLYRLEDNQDLEQNNNTNEDEKVQLARILDQLNNLDMIDNITIKFKED